MLSPYTHIYKPQRGVGPNPSCDLYMEEALYYKRFIALVLVKLSNHKNGDFATY